MKVKSITKVLILLSLIWYTAGCKCIEKESLINLNETIIPEYKAYVEQDSKLSERQKAIRLLRIKTFNVHRESLYPFFPGSSFHRLLQS